LVRRLPRCLVWIGLYVALIVYPTECAAYERDVHFSVTLWLAELIGFQEANAFDFAALDDVTDYHPESQPLPTVADGLELGVRRRVLFHFVDRARVNELQRLALACTPKRTTRVQQRDIGHYLHAVSDFYSHEGYEAIAGHALVFGFPDKPWNRPFQLRKMINEKFEALTESRVIQ